MDENCDIENEASESTGKEAFLKLDPGARFGIGSLPGMPTRHVVLLSSAASPLDLRVLRTLAGELGYEMHPESSALGTAGGARAGSWFTPDVMLAPVSTLPAGNAHIAVEEYVETLAA